MKKNKKKKKKKEEGSRDSAAHGTVVSAVDPSTCKVNGDGDVGLVVELQQANRLCGDD